MLATTDLRYSCAVIDFPWTFKNPGSMHGANGRKGIRPKYPCWSDAQVLAFDVPFEIKPQAHAWIWAPIAKERVAEEWLVRHGFRLPGPTKRYWHKPQPNTGYWCQTDIEVVILGVKGPVYRNEMMQHELGYFPRSVIGNPHGGKDGRWEVCPPAEKVHSSKPHAFYREALAMSPGPHLSLFERTERDGFYGAGSEYAEGSTVFAVPEV